MPLQDNSTRWNSHFDSITRAIKLRHRIEAFSSQYRQEIQQDVLGADDWTYLEEIQLALGPFHRTTKELESTAGNGRHGSIWEWLPTIEALLFTMKEGQKRVIAKYYTAHPLSIAYQNAWEKLHKWYEESDKSHTIYAAATLFSPMARKAYFDRNWDPEWRGQMLKAVHDYYLKNYHSKPQNSQSKQTKPVPSPIDVQLGLASYTEEGVDQYTAYIEGAPFQYKLDILNWWATAGPPELRQMAFDLLSIPAMSAEVERTFSSAKRLLTPDRNALSVESLETYELLRNWWLRDIVLQSQNQAEEGY